MSAPRPFRCSICSQEFTRSENLQRHRTSRHGGTSRHKFECTKCHARFHRRDVCKRHAERCNGHTSCSRSRRLSPSTASALDATRAGISTTSPLSNASHGNAVSPTDFPDAATAQHVGSYFVHFHRSIPILHRPTFTLNAAPVTLLRTVVAIGSLYAAPELPHNDRELLERRADQLWECGRKELKALVVRDRKEVREGWVIQAFILYILYGIYRDDGTRFQKARSMFRILVDGLRDLELFHQTLTADEDTSWETDLAPDLGSNESLLDSKWAAFISKESLKLSLYALVFLDSHIFKTCNLRPMISAIELGWELPHATFLWEANTSAVWLERLYQDGCGAAVSLDITTQYRFQGTATTSLTSATQSLMSGSPCPHLLAALSASSFTILCIAANLDCLVQDFTRCYYQLPPSLSDPSAFHILTQSQNKSIAAALRSIAAAAAASSRDDSTPSDSSSPRQQQQQQQKQQQQQQKDAWCSDLRYAASLTALSVKVALCAPDDLLIGGIVDNSVAAGLATSAHLTLGSYFASRRSTQTASGTQEQLDGAGSLALLIELMPALDDAAARSGDGTTVCGEAPWVTVATIRLLLTLWKTLRQVIQHARQSSAVPAFDPARIALQAVNGRAEEHIRSLAPDFDPGSGDGEEAGEVAFGKLERCMLFLASEICKRRHVWPVGPALATVFEEIMDNRGG